MKYINLMVVGYVIIILLAITGYIKCVVHLIQSDFKAPYKAEVIYGIGTVSGLGAIIGWIDIKD